MSGAGGARPARALLVVGGLDVGGIETYVVRLRRHADPARCAIDVCHGGADDGAYAAELRALGARVLRIGGKQRAVGYVPRLAAALRAGGYDAVCDFTGDFAAPALVAAWLAGVPRRIAFYRSSGISHAADPARMLYRRAMRAVVARAATHVLSNSRAALARFYPGAVPGEGKLRVLYNGVDTAAFAPADPAARSRAKAWFGLGGRFVLGHVGGLKPVKNHALLVEVIDRLRARVPGAALLLVGDGSERGAIEAAARRRGVSDRVVLAGARRDVAGCLAAMDAFVFPSLFEGMSNALIEAQAAGLPVVASDAPGVIEHIPAGARRFVLPVRDPGRWVEAVAVLAGDDGLRAAQGRIHRAHAVARYGQAARFDELLGLLSGRDR